MTKGISNVESLLISHGHAMIEGVISDSDSNSIPQIINAANDLKWGVLTLVSGAFAFQYIVLVFIVGRGLRGRTDIESRLRKSYAQLEEIAKLDSLTGLLNRRAIRDLAEVEISQSERDRTGLGFILLDLDNLKTINDQHGHVVGDLALKQVADTIQETMRVGDWCGRWGGDEILWVLPKVNQADTIKISERFRNILEVTTLKISDGNFLTLKVSQGISNIAANTISGKTFDDLFSQADRALYQSKRRGENSISHFGEVHHEHLENPT